MNKKILYLHGFNSSPQSVKVKQTQRFLADNYPKVEFICPQQFTDPKAVIAQLEAIIEHSPSADWKLMGSSLGGYLSIYLAEKYQLDAVLINPAIKPFDSLTKYLGEQTQPYTGEVYQVTEQHMQALKFIEQVDIYHKKSKNNYFVMVQTGDEVLDYQQAVDKFQHSQLIIQEGGDHSFVDYDKMLPEIATFLQL